MNELLGILVTNTVSLLVLVAAYAYMWWRGRQHSMGLWGLGWTLYMVRSLFLAGELLTTGSTTPWQFASLSTLGLYGLLLLAGAYSFANQPPSPRIAAWGILPLAWALLLFAPYSIDDRILAVPITIFSTILDIATARVLLRYSRSTGTRKPAWGLALIYGLWAASKIASAFMSVQSIQFEITFLLTNGLALGLAFSLIAFSLTEAERHARRRTGRLKAFATLTGVTGQLFSPEALLPVALEEMGKLLDIESGLGAFLLLGEEQERQVQLTAQRGISACFRLQEDSSDPQGCPCIKAIDERRLVTFTPKEQEEYSSHCSAMMAVPLVSRQKTLGVICASLPPERILSDGEKQTLEALGRQLATALENAQLFSSMMQEKTWLELLHRLSQRLSASLDVHQVAQWALDEICAVLGAMRGMVYVKNPIGGHHLELAALSGYDGEPVGTVDQRIRIHIGEGLAGWVAEHMQSILVDDVTTNRQWVPVPGIDDWVRSVLCVPLISRNSLVGVISILGDREASFDQGHLQLAESVAATVAAAIANARAYEETRQALQELQDLDRLRNEVIQNVSHELRTPLTLIQGYTELLMAGDLGPIPASQEEVMQVIHDRTETLSRLIHDLTALQTIPSETLSLEPLPIRDVIEPTLKSYRGSAERSGIQLELDLADNLPMLLADYEHLTLAFSHLIDNAIKFSPDGGLVQVRAWVNNRYMHIAVQDPGIGIAKEHINAIFERFYQVDGSTTRRFGGMGIGLSLVWTIVEAHQGTVRVKSELGQGSTFTLILPCLE